MAVDTKEKRAAALSYGSPWRAGTHPPRGAVSTIGRAAVLGCYFFVSVTSYVIRAVASVISRDGAVFSQLARNGARASVSDRNGSKSSGASTDAHDAAHVQPPGTSAGAIT